MSQPTLLVTGDIVLDCHLYGGVKTAATSFSEPGTRLTQHLGGAVLTHKLLRAAADAGGFAWDAKERAWAAENDRRQKAKKSSLPRPDDIAGPRPAPSYGTHLGIDTTNLEVSLPGHLRSYGVWTSQPVDKKGSKGRIWRIRHEDHFGYGPTGKATPEAVFKRAASGPPVPPVLTVIDDGGILFRHESAKDVWPQVVHGVEHRYLLKMSWPLCRGDFWASLGPMMDRLTVVVAADDLRREDSQINARLSWEQCVEHTIAALRGDPVAHELLRAGDVIINFRSAGALWIHRGANDQKIVYRLLFDAERLEGDYGSEFDGTTYGFQTCLAAAIAHHLMQERKDGSDTKMPGPFVSPAEWDRALQQGITSGLMARRRLLELGHGPVGSDEPGFPLAAIGQAIAETVGGFVPIEVPASVCSNPGCPWTILNQSEAGSISPGAPAVPLTGLAHLTARYGRKALSHVPALRRGALFTVDRSEIESFRALDALITKYEGGGVQKKPLSIGVFGPPGAGKSFGVEALAKSVLGDKVPFLEFNLSQFNEPHELIGAFHRVRDAVLKGVTPVAFWDEFDSRQYKWLQYLLAPMQDGAFQEGQIIHPIGKCVFVFAGGTSPTLEAFGVAEPLEPTPDELAALEPARRQERLEAYREQATRYRDFRLLKGPDFISRLHGFLNVLGPNPRAGTACPDITWPIRRAIILRGILRLKDDAELEIDPGLLNALLSVPKFQHGARSFEKVISALVQGSTNGRLHRSALPPRLFLERETDAGAFQSLLTQRDAFKNHPDIEDLAAIVHNTFIDEAKRTKIQAEIDKTPHTAWTVHPAILTDYLLLPEDKKVANREAARRIPDHLALIGFVVERQEPGDDGSWKAPLEAAIAQHLDRLAQAEHLGWGAERIASGWTYDKVRDDDHKRHPLLVDWAQLSVRDQDKDRSSARSIPKLLEEAKCKAVRVKAT